MEYTYRSRVYKDGANEWRWALDHANGNCIMVSAEGYKNRLDLIQAVRGAFGHQLDVMRSLDLLEMQPDDD